MKKAIMKAWVARLRSGEYKQTTAVLDRGDGSYCCLGVLCTMALEEGVVECVQGSGRSVGYGRASYFSSLPEEVMKWAGMKSKLGQMGYEGDLASLNDALNSFNKIADVIEKNWKQL